MAKQKLKTTAERVGAYRARIAKAGGRTIYANIGADANTALNTIIERKGYSIAGAIEYALMRIAKDATRAR